MSRRLSTDAKIVLERAGYTVQGVKIGSKKHTHLAVGETPSLLPNKIAIEGGTVDNSEVVKLLAARGFDETGYPIRK